MTLIKKVRDVDQTFFLFEAFFAFHFRNIHADNN
jgi:hypothetical protein